MQPLNPLMQEGVGRVSYEECGECFFIPYSVDDVENGAKIRQNDIVSFRVCTNKRYVSYCHRIDYKYITMS